MRTRAELRCPRSVRRSCMAGNTIRISSSEGGEFDCYLALPVEERRVPAMVIGSAVHGITADIRALADEFASHGYIAAAPDLFWRTVPGPLSRDDDRVKLHSQPRHEKIKTGEIDLVDVRTALCKLPQSNGRAAVIGL